MPEFLNPFSGVVPDRKLKERELTRSIRMALAAEEEAVHLYEALADASDNAFARDVLQEVANEERVHAGEFLRLLSTLLPDEDGRLAEGAGEVNAMQRAGRGAAAEPPAVGEDKRPTVGTLKGGDRT